MTSGCAGARGCAPSAARPAGSCTIHDRRVKRWRHLDSRRQPLLDRVRAAPAALPGLRRPARAGAVGRPGAAHPRDFEDVVAWLAQQMAFAPITRLLRVGWHDRRDRRVVVASPRRVAGSTGWSASASRRCAHSARAANATCEWVVVTHPFHPLRGQRLAVLFERRCADGRLYVCEGGPFGTIRVPEDATDRVRRRRRCH